VGKLLSTAFAPVGVLWALAESRVWLSIAIFAALTVGAVLVGRPGIAALLASVLAVLLMRSDAILDTRKAAQGA
jgi:hypothetical protein